MASFLALIVSSQLKRTVLWEVIPAKIWSIVRRGAFSKGGVLFLVFEGCDLFWRGVFFGSGAFYFILEGCDLFWRGMFFFLDGFFVFGGMRLLWRGVIYFGGVCYLFGGM